MKARINKMTSAQRKVIEQEVKKLYKETQRQSETI